MRTRRGKGFMCPHCRYETHFWFDDSNFFLFVCFHCWQQITIPLEHWFELGGA